jgi:hypothetical protein
MHGCEDFSYRSDSNDISSAFSVLCERRIKVFSSINVDVSSF